MIFCASPRASSSCRRYCSSSRSASPLASSDFSRPSRILLDRSANVLFTWGKTFHVRKPNRMKNAIEPKIISTACGRMNLVSSAARSAAIISHPLLDDEEQHEPEQGERFGEGEPDEHQRLDLSTSFGLAGDGFDRLAEADA